MYKATKRELRNLTIGQKIEILGVLKIEQWTLAESEKYIKFITFLAKKIRKSVYFVWQTQRKYSTAQVNDLIKSFTI